MILFIFRISLFGGAQIKFGFQNRQSLIFKCANISLQSKCQSCHKVCIHFEINCFIFLLSNHNGSQSVAIKAIHLIYNFSDWTKTYFTFLFRARHQSQKFILQKRQTQKLEGEQTKWKHNFQTF